MSVHLKAIAQLLGYASGMVSHLILNVRQTLDLKVM